MKIAVIGCGSIGQRHIGNLLILGHEVVAFNRGKVRRKQVASKFDIDVYDDLDQMLNEFSADAAIIATTPSNHLAHSLKVAKVGLHLFTEKPLSHNLEGLEQLIEMVERRGLITHVGSNMRFHFGPSLINQKLKKGELGSLLWAHLWGGMHLPDWHPWEDYRKMYSAKISEGGGVVLDFIHELDLVLWLFGSPGKIVAMTCKSGSLDIETEDIADILFSYHAGLQVNMHLDYLQKPFQRGIRIIGEKGWVCWDLARSFVEVYHYEKGEFKNHKYPDGYNHNDMYVKQMEYFISCIDDKRPSESDIRAGYKALELAMKVKESALKGVSLEVSF